MSWTNRGSKPRVTPKAEATEADHSPKTLILILGPTLVLPWVMLGGCRSSATAPPPSFASSATTSAPSPTPGPTATEAATPTMAAIDGGLVSGSFEVLEGHGPVVDLEYSPDGSQLALASERAVSVYGLDPFQALWQKETEFLLYDMTWSPEGDRLALAIENGGIALWSAENGEELRLWGGHDDDVFAVDWSKESRGLASGGEDGWVRIWQIDSAGLLDMLAEQPASGPVSGLQWSEGDHLLILSKDALVWETETGELTRAVVYYYEGPIASWSASEEKMAYASPSRGLRIEKSGTDLDYHDLDLPGSVALVTHVGWSPDARMLLSGYEDGQVILWDAWTGEKLDATNGHDSAITASSWSPSLGQFATGSQDGILILWQTRGCVSPAEAEPDEAGQTLFDFFNLLGDRRFEQAAPLFGLYSNLQYQTGDYEAGQAELLSQMCDFLVCMPIERIVSQEQLTPTEFRFSVIFTDERLGYDIHGLEALEVPYRVILDCQGQFRVMGEGIYPG